MTREMKGKDKVHWKMKERKRKAQNMKERSCLNAKRDEGEGASEIGRTN